MNSISEVSRRPHERDLSASPAPSRLRVSALRGASLTVAAQGINSAVAIVGTIFLARLLTPDDFGLVAMVLSISLLLANFGTNGFIEATIQREEINHGQVSTLFWISALMCVGLTLALMASAPLIVWFYREPLVGPIVIAMALSILPPGLSNQHQALLRRRMEYFKASLIDVISTTLGLAAALYMAFAGWGPWALVTRWLVTPTLAAIGVWMACEWRPGPPRRDPAVGPMMRFSLSTYGNFVVNYFRRNVDKILVGRFLGIQALGNYDRAYQLSHTLLNQVIGPLNSVALSAFSRVANDKEKFRRHFLGVLSTLSFACMPLAAALTLTGQDLIVVLLGPQWIGAGVIFLAFGFSIGVEVIYRTHPWLHLSLGTPNRWFRWGIVSFAVSTCCMIAGLGLLGPVGVALGFSLSNYILMVPGVYYAGRPMDIGIRAILNAVAKYFAAAAMAAGITWFLLYSLGATSPIFLGLGVISRILVSGSLCVLTYLLVLIAVFRSGDSITQFVTLIDDAVGRKLR